MEGVDGDTVASNCDQKYTLVKLCVYLTCHGRQEDKGYKNSWYFAEKCCFGRQTEGLGRLDIKTRLLHIEVTSNLVEWLLC